MSNPFRYIRNGFLIEHAALVKAHLHAEPLADQILQNPNLHLSHKPDMNFPALRLPDYVKLRFFLLKFT